MCDVRWESRGHHTVFEGTSPIPSSEEHLVDCRTKPFARCNAYMLKRRELRIAERIGLAVLVEYDG